ncbi:MAG: hypothetical protein COX62_03080 [Deltaproteobacteria bacterium CG_4_10_14_0_2_um_filter_43_8]|nr:MAG: hypothetical protein COV43_09175 [Deltaproteobacteria bacterium CG11_big_fil_rev_8_21_14_0_20_42_23]PJA21190.1 MAG: hypothetical protein COX62_03080 [Deltaproteobacteria bacterium CG_4_10_14_0_2_um_filter_43_8]PJC64800.1 MAG: hypothetical protein CO021_02450 [Deltaproteobacteria bacterium CG_4_9_14_0_2_um_filter_42_21]
MSQQETWKSFDDNVLTHSAAHYLMTISELIDDQGYARVTDIARLLGITRGSCSISLKPLKKRGLVLEDHNKFLLLSDEGKRMAKLIEKNDQLLQILFRDVLGVSADQAEIDACKLEHLISFETSVQLERLVNFINSKDKVVSEFLKKMQTYPACERFTEEKA